MKRPKPKPPTVRQVLGRIESRCLELDKAVNNLASSINAIESRAKTDRDATAKKLAWIDEQDKNVSARFDETMATLRNHVENLRYKFDTGGMQRAVDELRSNQYSLVLQAANAALVLMIQELERLGLKPVKPVL